MSNTAPAVSTGTTIVIKFGGTALGSASRIRAAARRVRALMRQGHQPVVVVSATGHTTDRLLRRLRSAGAEHPSTFAIGREADRALCTGEDLSAALLATALLALGVPAVSLRGGEAGILAAGEFGAAAPVRLAPGAIEARLIRGEVPVISGFQAVREDGELVTLGRGGSDLSAVFIAAQLGATECCIVTDVDGVYSADPRRVPDAVRLHTMGHEELVQLARAGAEVVHPAAAEVAAHAKVPLRVLRYSAPVARPSGSVVGFASGSEP